MLLRYGVSQLHALHNEFFASIPQLLILLLQRLAHFEQVEAFLLPDSCHRGVITFQHLQLELHLFHFLNDLLRLDLLLYEFIFEDANCTLLLVFDKAELAREVISNARERAAFLILFA